MRSLFPIAGVSTVLLVLGGATSLAAQAVPAGDPNTLSLSDAQKADVLAHNDETSVNAARAGLGAGSPGRQIHGEIDAMIGTHGTRGIAGTAAIPLGENSGATVSFESSRTNWRR